MKKLLFLLDTDPFTSVFDTVVAYDGGADRVAGYAGVTPDNVGPLVDGTIFTRGGKDKQNTAIFVGGGDMGKGEALFAAVQKKFFGPFRVSAMLDSNGSNTTAAAGVALLAKSLDRQGELIAFLEEYSRVPRHADPRRRAGGDHVARLERHEAADIAHEMRHAEDHGGGIAGLHARPVEIEREAERLRIRNLIFGDEPGAERPETGVAFRLDPLAWTALLQAPLRHVVGDHVAGDVG